MNYFCLIENDQKCVKDIKSFYTKYFDEIQLEFISFLNLDELYDWTKSDKKSDKKIELLILTTDVLQILNVQELHKIKDLYNCSILLTCYDDPTKPLKQIETWPIENIIFKPFDLAILEEQMKASLFQTVKLKPTTVQISKENFEIEKIRRQFFTAFCDYGFKLNSSTDFEIGKPYKFYHFLFENQKIQSLWVKPIYKQNFNYEFVFCYPQKSVTTNIRKKINESTQKLKAIKLNGYEKFKNLIELHFAIELADKEDTEIIKKFFKDRYPKVKVTETNLAGYKPDPNLKFNLVIADFEYYQTSFVKKFGTDPLYFHVNQCELKDRILAEKILSIETIRLTKPIDRYYLSRMISAYFPNIFDADPLITNWIEVNDEALYSQIVVAKEFSETSFNYERNSLLTRGSYQEFALPVDDETELKILKARVHHIDTTPSSENLYSHQVIFYSIRDNILKRIRLWMHQKYINKNGST